jgi:hypothetical protein
MSELNVPSGAAAPESEAAAPGCACTLFAVVRANGTLERGCKALESQRRDDGISRVRFDRDVSKCAWVATIGLPDDGISPVGEISVAGFIQSDVVASGRSPA